MKEFNEALLNGIAYEYHRNNIRRNDIRWFILLILTIGITVGMMENRKPVIIDNSKEVERYCDSLQFFVDTTYNITERVVNSK